MGDLTASQASQFIQIVDETTGNTPEVSNDRRLLVAAKVDAEVDVWWKQAYLTNGSSKEMAVNGSTTPVNFTASPTSGEIWFIESLSIFLFDNGSTDPEDFGALGGIFGSGPLANGLLLEGQSLGSLRTYSNLKDNVDVTFAFPDKTFSPDGIAGFYNNNDILIAQARLKRPITLKGSQSDFFRAVVRDDLTGLNMLRIGINYWFKI